METANFGLNFSWAGKTSAIRKHTINNRREIRKLWLPIIAQVGQALANNLDGEPDTIISLAPLTEDAEHRFRSLSPFACRSNPPASPGNALPQCKFSSIFCQHVFTSIEDLEEHVYYRHNAFVAAPIEAQYCYICQKWLNAFPDPFAICRHQRSHAAQLLEEFVDSQMLTPPEEEPYRWLPLVDNYVVIWPGICPICLQYR